MRTLVSKLLPEWAKTPLRHTRSMMRTITYHGKERFCPVCRNSSNRFKPYGRVPREDAQCAHCGSLERHRFLWLFLERETDLFSGRPKKILHVAPEPCLELRLKNLFGGSYLTADLSSPRAMVKMDICDIQFPNHSFDVIYCNHVLEHVLDDRKAMQEFFRVLKTNQWAILNVPITREKTFEDSSIVDPIERLKTFGQEDHVRCYGPDYVERLRDSGFTVKITRVSDLVGKDEAVKMGLTPASGEIYYCTK